jgi:DNA repair protein RecO (recombination protein O)
MYSVYTTAGFVLGSAERGEANKIFSIYTEDFGLVRASAQGVRLEKSKLRYTLDDFARGHFSLVKGKELWRLTGSERDGDSIASIEARRIVARVLNLVRRLVHGEERNPDLFVALDLMMKKAREISSVSGDLVPFELLSLLRVLHALGYLGVVQGIDDSILTGDMTDDALSLVSKSRTGILFHINRALEETQL